jgi:hypothetical protein
VTPLRDEIYHSQVTLFGSRVASRLWALACTVHPPNHRQPEPVQAPIFCCCLVASSILCILWARQESWKSILNSATSKERQYLHAFRHCPARPCKPSFKTGSVPESSVSRITKVLTRLKVRFRSVLSRDISPSFPSCRPGVLPLFRVESRIL